MIFDCDEIHKIRVENAARRAGMTKEEARRDLEAGAEKTRRAIEEIRRKRTNLNDGVKKTGLPAESAGIGESETPDR